MKYISNCRYENVLFQKSAVFISGSVFSFCFSRGRGGGFWWESKKILFSATKSDYECNEELGCLRVTSIAVLTDNISHDFFFCWVVLHAIPLLV